MTYARTNYYKRGCLQKVLRGSTVQATPWYKHCTSRFNCTNYKYPPGHKYSTTGSSTTVQIIIHTTNRSFQALHRKKKRQRVATEHREADIL